MKDNCRNWNKFVGDKIPSSLEIHPIIYKFIQRDWKIIDIGCGFGKTIFNLYKKGYVDIYGVDINKSGIKFANLTSKQLKLDPKPKFKIANALYLPYRDSMFDCVITQAFWTAIVTMKERLQIIKEISRVIKKNGILYIADFEQTWRLPIYKNYIKRALRKVTKRELSKQ